MSKIKKILLLIPVVLMASCSDVAEKEENIYIKSFLQKSSFNCSDVDDLFSKNQIKYDLNNLYPNLTYSELIRNGKQKNIYNQIIEIKIKKGKSDLFIYFKNEVIILAINFKGVDDTEIYINENQIYRRLVCDLVENEKFVLNSLSEDSLPFTPQSSARE